MECRQNFPRLWQHTREEHGSSEASSDTSNQLYRSSVMDESDTRSMSALTVDSSTASRGSRPWSIARSSEELHRSTGYDADHYEQIDKDYVHPRVLQQLRSMSMTPPPSASSQHDSGLHKAVQSSLFQPDNIGKRASSEQDPPIWHTVSVSKHLHDLLDRCYYNRGVIDCCYIDEDTLHMLDSMVRSCMRSLNRTSYKMQCQDEC